MDPFLLTTTLMVLAGLLIGLWPLTKGINADQLLRGIAGFLFSAVPAALLTPIASLLIASVFVWRIKKSAAGARAVEKPAASRRPRLFDFAKRPMLSGLLLGLLLVVLLIVGYGALLVPIVVILGDAGTVVGHLALYLWTIFGAPWSRMLMESENGSGLISFFGGVIINGMLAGLVYGVVYGLINRRGSI